MKSMHISHSTDYERWAWSAILKFASFTHFGAHTHSQGFDASPKNWKAESIHQSHQVHTRERALRNESAALRLAAYFNSTNYIEFVGIKLHTAAHECNLYIFPATWRVQYDLQSE